MTNGTSTKTNRPEKTIGPYPGGIGIAIWQNTIQTADGPRNIRSITISPRRYRDSQTGEWRNAPSFRPGDIPALIFALEKAQEYILTQPIQSHDDQEIPF